MTRVFIYTFISHRYILFQIHCCHSTYPLRQAQKFKTRIDHAWFDLDSINGHRVPYRTGTELHSGPYANSQPVYFLQFGVYSVLFYGIILYTMYYHDNTLLEDIPGYSCAC